MPYYLFKLESNFMQIKPGETIGNKIREVRNNRNMSQNKFGKKIGLSGKTISAYETGRIIPSIIIMEKISEVYDVSLLVENHRKKTEVKNKIAILQQALNDFFNTVDRYVS